MGGGAVLLHVKLEVLTLTTNSVQHPPTKDGQTLTVIILIRTVMTSTLATRSGWEHITEWWRTTKTKSFNNERKLMLLEKGNIERWITKVRNKAWTKFTKMCMKGCYKGKYKLRSMLQGSKSIK
eukprot:4152132-Heterocapsa_arctica.AAC.1